MEIVGNERKFCNGCKQWKDIKQFGVVRGNSDGRRTRCKECANQVRRTYAQAHRDKILPKKRAEYQKNRDAYLSYTRSTKRKARWFEWKLKHQFGISVQQYEQMLSSQGGLCAICGSPPTEAKGHRGKPRLHVDHDHETGTVRGLLCNSCNCGLGCFGDDMEILASAFEYIEASKSFRSQIPKSRTA